MLRGNGGGGGMRHAWMIDVLLLRMFRLERVTKRVKKWMREDMRAVHGG